jgi:cell division protein FtsB
MRALRRAPIVGRHLLASAIALLVVVTLLAVFAGTLTRSTGTEARAEQVQAEITAMEHRVEAGEAALDFIKSDAYLNWAARLNGYGRPDEQPFRLADGAPAPAPITPIGPQERVVALAPFDAWMELLFGA